MPPPFRPPLNQFTRFIQAIPRSVRRELAFEGVLDGGGAEMAVRFLLTEPPGDLEGAMRGARTLLDLPKQHDGQAYATGAFFPDEAEATLGTRRLRWLQALHAAADPGDRLNPGVAFAGRTGAEARLTF